MTIPMQVILLGAAAVAAILYAVTTSWQSPPQHSYEPPRRRQSYQPPPPAPPPKQFGTDTHPNTQARQRKKQKKECSICLEVMETTIHNSMLECGHVFHRKCIRNWLEFEKICPLCRTTVRESI